MRKIYSYLFYRTYLSSAKVFPINAALRTSNFLSVFLFINIMSISFLLEEYLTKKHFTIILGIAIIICFLNAYYLHDRNTKIMIRESEDLKVAKIWKYAIDFYPHATLLFFLIAAKASINTIVISCGIYALYKLIEFLAKM